MGQAMPDRLYRGGWTSPVNVRWELGDRRVTKVMIASVDDAVRTADVPGETTHAASADNAGSACSFLA